ncbi:MAG TPA: zinc ribbon domain-containing protein [Gaiellaceae bacterium]|nr:zinc ribbon domain-containing protein [Gaiellaceae bacterium]
MNTLPLLSTFSSIHNVFHSTAFIVARNVVVFLAVVFWLALAYWVYKDARRRIDDPWLVGVASLLGLVPFLGPLVYLLFRPAETLEDVRSRNAELRALEHHLGRSRPSCPVCSTAVESDYLVCPVCATTLRQACASCDAPLEPLWQICPYCATRVEPAAIDLDAALSAEARTFSRNGEHENGAAPRRREPRAAES